MVDPFAQSKAQRVCPFDVSGSSSCSRQTAATGCVGSLPILEPCFWVSCIFRVSATIHCWTICSLIASQVPFNSSDLFSLNAPFNGLLKPEAVANRQSRENPRAPPTNLGPPGNPKRLVQAHTSHARVNAANPYWKPHLEPWKRRRGGPFFEVGVDVLFGGTPFFQVAPSFPRISSPSFCFSFLLFWGSLCFPLSRHNRSLFAEILIPA